MLKLYEPGNEGPLWWHKHRDKVRGLPPRGMLDRCLETKSCPKIIEHAGAAEVWGQKLTVGWLGTDPKTISRCRRTFAGTISRARPHGGGDGGFDVNPGDIPNCSSNNYGPGTFPENPLPQTQTVNALRFHFRNWVMKDIPPPDSVYPRIHDMVKPSKKAMGFPDIPAVLASANPDAP